jgi:hypothetical protein
MGGVWDLDYFYRVLVPSNERGGISAAPWAATSAYCGSSFASKDDTYRAVRVARKQFGTTCTWSHLLSMRWLNYGGILSTLELEWWLKLAD